MSKDTHIQWCDSTQNPQMGCEGCELVKGEKIICYAKMMTDRYAGRKGWPEAFEKPKIFMERVQPMLDWPDLTDDVRQEKTWLNGMPRIIFLNDMGDTFSRGMPEDWFEEVVGRIRNSPHQYLVLTKWPARFAKFAEKYPLPDNIWAGTSVMEMNTKIRVDQLRAVNAKVRFLSLEPMWEDLSRLNLRDISWVILGGESGLKATYCEMDWFRRMIVKCQAMDIPVFVKQTGSFIAKKLKFVDSSGGDWNEWPEYLRVREMPRLCG
jgi:protein gp37